MKTRLFWLIFLLLVEIPGHWLILTGFIEQSCHFYAFYAYHFFDNSFLIAPYIMDIIFFSVNIIIFRLLKTPVLSFFLVWSATFLFHFLQYSYITYDMGVNPCFIN